MVLEAGYRTCKRIIIAVDTILIRVRRLSIQNRMIFHFNPEGFTNVRVVRDPFRNDIRCTGKGILQGLHTLFRTEIILCQLRRISAVLLKNVRRQRFQSFFLCRSSTGTAFLLIGTVKILHLSQGRSLMDGQCQFPGQLSLILDGLDNLSLTLLQTPQIIQACFQVAKRGVIHTAVHFFTVASNEGNGIALIQQGHHILYIGWFLPQLTCQGFNNHIHNLLLFVFSGLL